MTSPTSDPLVALDGPTPLTIGEQVEAHIAERIRTGKQPSQSEIDRMRAWHSEMQADEPHPWYGPCDGMGANGGCSECERVSALAAPMRSETIMREGAAEIDNTVKAIKAKAGSEGGTA